VGSFPPVKIGDALVYDLGGNVSELFNNNGTFGLYGYSAIDFVDAADPEARIEFWPVIGFRVVLSASSP